MSRFALLTVGKSRCSWANEAVEHYAKRLKRYGGLSQEWVKVEKSRGDVEAVKLAEGKRLLSAAKKRVVFALDERGSALSTHQFAALINTAQHKGQLVFIIGGAFGLAADVRQRADHVVRLSDMVLNHELARIVLVEQLYRCLDLNAGGPYHH